MPRCVTNWEQRTLAYQATAGKAMNIHGGTWRRGEPVGGTARIASSNAQPGPRSRVFANRREFSVKIFDLVSIF